MFDLLTEEHKINQNRKEKRDRLILMKYRILIEQDEDGVFVIECPSLPGCISQGKTGKKAIKNIQDAIKGYLKNLKKHNEPVLPSIDEEIVEVTI